jgi:hypothetical protein
VASDGTLYVAKTKAGGLHTLDPVTGAILTATSLSSHAKICALTFVGGNLYGLENSGYQDTPRSLVRIDPITGVVTRVGDAFNMPSGLESLSQEFVP